MIFSAWLETPGTFIYTGPDEQVARDTLRAELANSLDGDVGHVIMGEGESSVEILRLLCVLRKNGPNVETDHLYEGYVRHLHEGKTQFYCEEKVAGVSGV